MWSVDVGLAPDTRACAGRMGAMDMAHGVNLESGAVGDVTTLVSEASVWQFTNGQALSEGAVVEGRYSCLACGTGLRGAEEDSSPPQRRRQQGNHPVNPCNTSPRMF